MTVSKGLLAIWCVLLLVAVPAATVGSTDAGSPSFGGTVVDATGAVGFSIDAVEITPGEPLPGEMVTVNTTISAGRDEVTIDRIVLRDENGETDSVANLWRLDSGEETSIALSTRLNSAGTHYLWVNVTVTTDDGETVHREKVVTVEADGVGPNLAVTSDAPIEDTKSTLSFTLTNTLDATMETVKLGLDGVQVRSGDGYTANLASGDSETFEFAVVADEPGLQTVTATVVFSTAEHDRRSVEIPLKLDVRPLDEDVELTTDREGGNVTLTVGNGGNVELQDVTVVAEANGETLDRALLGSVADHETESLALDLSDLDGSADVTVRAEYDVGTRSGTVHETITVSGAPEGKIELTGVSVVDESGTVRISGSASNVGLSAVDGVIVRVVDTDVVSPAEPNRDFFVGTVPKSDFVSFDVYATVMGDVDAIPVEVSYLVDGKRVERVVEVPYERSAGGMDDGASHTTEERPAEGDGGGLPLLPTVAVVLVIGVGAVVWRRRG